MALAQPKFELRAALEGVEAVLLSELKAAEKSTTHAPTKGGAIEEIWRAALRKFLPFRYQVETGFVVDHTGATSEQIDIVVFDRQYTPILLDENEHRLIPAEAVYAVFEVKTSIGKPEIVAAEKKVASVRKLHRTSASIVHALGTSGANELREAHKILGGILGPKVIWTRPLTARLHAALSTTGDGALDIGTFLANGGFCRSSAGLTVWEEKAALMRFLFQLQIQLNACGTVPAIDWNKYLAFWQSATQDTAG